MASRVTALLGLQPPQPFLPPQWRQDTDGDVAGARHRPAADGEDVRAAGGREWGEDGGVRRGPDELGV